MSLGFTLLKQPTIGSDLLPLLPHSCEPKLSECHIIKRSSSADRRYSNVIGSMHMQPNSHPSMSTKKCILNRFSQACAMSTRVHGWCPLSFCKKATGMIKPAAIMIPLTSGLGPSCVLRSPVDKYFQDKLRIPGPLDHVFSMGQLDYRLFKYFHFSVYALPICNKSTEAAVNIIDKPRHAR